MILTHSALFLRLETCLQANAESYQYLVESIRRFPSQNKFSSMIETSGFSKVSFRNFSGGIATLYWGWKI